jgi:hypothetical protein
VNRRDLLKILGLGTIGVTLPAALPLLAKRNRHNEIIRLEDEIKPGDVYCANIQYTRNWQPNTAYQVGDRVRFSNGKIITVAMAGTSASVEMINGTIVPLKGRV